MWRNCGMGGILETPVGAWWRKMMGGSGPFADELHLPAFAASCLLTFSAGAAETVSEGDPSCDPQCGGELLALDGGLCAPFPVAESGRGQYPGRSVAGRASQSGISARDAEG